MNASLSQDLLADIDVLTNGRFWHSRYNDTLEFGDSATIKNNFIANSIQ